MAGGDIFTADFRTTPWWWEDCEWAEEPALHRHAVVPADHRHVLPGAGLARPPSRRAATDAKPELRAHAQQFHIHLSSLIDAGRGGHSCDAGRATGAGAVAEQADPLRRAARTWWCD